MPRGLKKSIRKPHWYWNCDHLSGGDGQPHHLRPLEGKNWLCEGEASQRFPRGTQKKET